MALLWGVGVVEVETRSHTSQPLWHTLNLSLSLYFLSTLTDPCLFGTLIIVIMYPLFYPSQFFSLLCFLTSFHPPMPCSFHHKSFNSQLDKDATAVSWWLRVLPKQNYTLSIHLVWMECTIHTHAYTAIPDHLTSTQLDHSLTWHFLISATPGQAN